MLRSHEVSRMATEFGLTVRNNLIVSDRYQYGRIGETNLYLNEGANPSEIPLENFEMFSCENRGSGDLSVWAHLSDGRKIELARVDYSPPKRYEGFIFKDGEPLMPSSISELEAVWFIIFPDFNSKCWFEVTDNAIYVDRSLIEEDGVEEMSDALMTRITSVVQNKLRDLGCIKRPPGKELVADVLCAMADRNRRNKFLDMMREVLWDGNNRLEDVFTCVLGGRMEGLTPNESKKVLEDVAKCWFIGAVARQFKPVQLDIFPIIMGATGISKSGATKWIAGYDEYHLEITDIDEKKFVENSSGRLILEFAELTATKGHTNNFLKAFLSKSSDRLRLAYARYSTNNHRRFVMIGTSNEYEVLTDPTGNRRYFPFEASPERSTVGFGPNGFREQSAKEFIKQVWAEAYTRYLKGESYYLSEETLLLAEKSQESAIINNPNVDLLISYLEEENRLGTMKICKKDLIYILTHEYNVEPKEAEHAANIWWKMPHPDWTRPIPTTINSIEHGWMPEGDSTSQRCMTRILGRSITMHSTKRLGQ